MLRCKTRSGLPYSGVVPDAGVKLTAVTKTRSGRPYTVVVPDAKIKQRQLDGASSPVPPGVMVEEGQRGAPTSEGVIIATSQRTILRPSGVTKAHRRLPALTPRVAKALAALRKEKQGQSTHVDKGHSGEQVVPPSKEDHSGQSPHLLQAVTLNFPPNVETHFPGYYTASRQAPPPLCDKMYVCQGPAEQPSFGLVLITARQILGNEHACDAFAYSLEQTGQMCFHIDTSPNECCSFLQLCHCVGPIPDNAYLDPEIRKLVGALLKVEDLAEKLAAHLVEQLYTGSNEPSTFYLEQNDSGVQMISSNIEQEIKGSLYLHKGRVVRCNRSAEGDLLEPLGLPGRVRVMITILADLMEPAEDTTKIAGATLKDSKADRLYPGNLTARTVSDILLMIMEGDPLKTRDILLRACCHLRSQAYQVGFFLLVCSLILKKKTPGVS